MEVGIELEQFEIRLVVLTVFQVKLSGLLFGRYIMIACDGLWKSFTMEESINFVNSVLKVSFFHLISGWFYDFCVFERVHPLCERYTCL